MLIQNECKIRSLTSLTAISLAFLSILPLAGYAFGKHASLCRTYDGLIAANENASSQLSFKIKRRNALMMVSAVTGQTESYIHQKFGQPQRLVQGPIKCPYPKEAKQADRIMIYYPVSGTDGDGILAICVKDNVCTFAEDWWTGKTAESPFPNP